MLAADSTEPPASVRILKSKKTKKTTGKGKKWLKDAVYDSVCTDVPKDAGVLLGLQGPVANGMVCRSPNGKVGVGCNGCYVDGETGVDAEGYQCCKPARQLSEVLYSTEEADSDDSDFGSEPESDSDSDSDFAQDNLNHCNGDGCAIHADTIIV